MPRRPKKPPWNHDKDIYGEWGKPKPPEPSANKPPTSLGLTTSRFMITPSERFREVALRWFRRRGVDSKQPAGGVTDKP